MSCPTFSSQIVQDTPPTENWDTRLASSVITTYKRLVVAEAVAVDKHKNPRHNSRVSAKELLLDKGKINRTTDPSKNTVLDFIRVMGGIPQ